MMISPYNILRHEIIGLEAEIVQATHNEYKCKGVVTDETRNTITIKTEKGKKILPKNCIVLDMKIPDGTIVRVDGKLLVARPEDRIKKKFRIKFV